MKVILALWILAVVTKEVHPSTLVRLPRHALSKPTSSVHTEYEATYEQKGRRGNGSYSTVSGKQEVVHNNCGDNWNAFADKCASLIKDLVASLANAVSSKPGDATNLQLRIKNTLTHFDSTDNCTCLNHTKNGLSGMDLSSLFDNITISTVHPASNNGNSLTTPAQQPDGGRGDNAENGAPETAPPAVTQPNLATANAQHVDPESADAPDELSNGNTRRRAQYPQPATDTTQVPVTSATTVQRLPLASPTPAGPRRTLSSSRVTQGPVFTSDRPLQPLTEVTLPPSQPKTSRTSTQSARQTPVRTAVPVELPERNNNIQKSGTLLTPATAPSSASQVSSPQQPAFGSPSASNDEEQDETPVVVPVKPVRNSISKDGESSSGIGSRRTGARREPVVPTTGRVNGAVAEPLTSSAGAPLANGVSNTPVVLTPVADDEDESHTTPSDSDDDTHEGNNSGTYTTPVFTPVKTESRVTSSDSEDESPAGEDSETDRTSVAVPVEPTGGSDNGAADEPLASSRGSSLSEGSGLTEIPTTVITQESQTTPSDRDDESPEENTRDVGRTTVTVLTAGESGNGRFSESRTTHSDDSDDNEDGHSGSTPIPVVITPTTAPEKVSGGEEGNGAEVIPTGDAQPATSLQEPTGTVSDAEDSPVVVPAKDAAPQSPLSSDSAEPGEAQVLQPVQVQSASPDNAKVNPGSLTKRPQGEQTGQRLSPDKVPVINSHSDLPETSDPVDNAGTLKPSPVYVPVPTTPSPIPSSNHNLQPVVTERGGTSRVPTTSDDAAEGGRGAQSSGRVPTGEGGRKANENIFIVTPTPVYGEKTNREIEPESLVTTSDFEETTVAVVTGDSSNGGNKSSVAPVYVVGRKTGNAASDSGDGQQGTLLTTPAQQIIPVTPIPVQNVGDRTEPLNRVPVVQPPSGQQSSQGPADSDLTPVDTAAGGVPSGGVVQPVTAVPEDSDLTKPTTFQTTSTDPTPPQTSAPQDSYETLHRAPPTSPKTPISKDTDDDDDDEEDCCSCESCTDEEITNPKQYKEIACKDLEEARRELKAIFDKIKKKLKCGRKAPQKIVAS